MTSNVEPEFELSEEQKQLYWKNGYVIIKDLIDMETLNQCKQRFIDICDGKVERGNMTVMKELALIKSGLTGERLINKVQDILYDPVFDRYTSHPRLLAAISGLLGADVTAVHSMMINKPPGTGAHPPHQDLYYFPFRPAEGVAAAWTAVDAAAADNGCLYAVPGSHAGPLRPHGYSTDEHGVVNKMYHGILGAGAQGAGKGVAAGAVPLPMAPGDTVLFHPLLVHGSGPNVTQRYRKSISCHYAASSCRYVAVDAPIVAEVEEMARRRGFDLSYIDIWRYRSKQVKGVRSNL